MSDSNHYEIDDIKRGLTVWQVLRHHGHPVDDGKTSTLCPIHSEKSPSFHIKNDGSLYNCFGCGAGGDVITLYQEISGCNRHEAIVNCGKLAGLSAGERPPEFHVPPPPKSHIPHLPENIGKVTLRDRLGPFTPEVEEEAIQEALRCIDGKVDGDSSNILTAFCARKKLSLGFIRECIENRLIGVFAHSEIKSPAIAWLYDNPIYGKACKLRFTADSSRITMWWDGKAQEHFFGEQRLRHASQSAEESKVIVAEGESDVLTLLQIGVSAIGATGAGILPCFKLTHLLLAYRNFAVVYDADNAGRLNTTKMQDHVSKNASGSTLFKGIMSKIPEGMDIGQCFTKWDARFSDYVKKEIDRMVKNN